MSARELLERAYAEVVAGAAGPLISLAPDRDRATPYPELADALLAGRSDAVDDAFRRGLAGLARAMLDAFPGNLFWDLDLVGAAVLREAGDDPAMVQERFDQICELQHLYGRGTRIRFRYVHDFTYGYDWAKWVGREPAQDGTVGPFDGVFLAYMRRRAHELLDLIDADDAKYPKLRDDRPRNPFPFSREPDAEVRLHRELARRGLVPVETWRTDATPQWDREFADLRVAVAGELGLLHQA